MKRRLSVACAFIGDPPVVYLDEPSTGLDPASRQQLWDVILRAKKNKSIILTTHHLEEAEVLCDRIGIMAAGDLRCIGEADALKRRFGAGYTLQITCPAESGLTEKAHAMIKSLLPSARLLDSAIAGVAKFEVMHEDVQLSTVYLEMEN
jgi:ABC-type multidrug transport system ATPase subunit